MNKFLDKSYNFFEENRKSFVKNHLREYVVIKEDSVLGFYKTEKDAYDATIKDHALGTFLIQQCLPEKKEEVAVFHSRVSFP